MDNSSKLNNIRTGINAWNDARILTHVANIGRTHDLANLKLYNPDMITRTYDRNPVDAGNGNYYHNNAISKTSLDYARTGNTLPYHIDTMQNPYRPPQPLEGFAFRGNKVTLAFSEEALLFIIIML